MNLPDGERLILTIDRDVEKDCLCQQEHYVSCAKLADGGVCGGTGRVTRRLRGFVEIYADIEDECIYYSAHSYNRYGYTVIELREHIVDDWKAGALPPDIAANLEVVD